MGHQDQALLLSIVRNDLVAFFHWGFRQLNPGTSYSEPWYVDALAYELRECMSGANRNLLVAMPPRYAKSTFVSVLFAAYLLGHEPWRRIICASYNQDLAAKFHRDFRRIVESAMFKKMFPRFEIASVNDRELVTTENGGRFSTSIEGTLTGIGADYILLDDLMKALDAGSELERARIMQWLQGTVFTRLDNKAEGRIISVGHRLHPLDSFGELQETGNWRTLVLPAIAQETETFHLARLHGHIDYTRSVGDILDPAREPLEVLDRLKAEMGSANFNAQYLQRPEFTGDSYIDWKWLPTFEAAPQFDCVIVSIDPAISTKSTADFSAIMAFGVRGNDSYIIHAEARRLGYDQLCLRIEQVARACRADVVLIEKPGLGTSLIDRYVVLHNSKAIPWACKNATPKTDKVTRMIQVLPYIEAGRLWVPAKAGFIDLLRDQYQAFPHNKYDDLIDTTSQFLGNRLRLIDVARGICVHRPRHRWQYDYLGPDQVRARS